MKILVYGAGPLGSLFAARLTQAGHDVALLARGQRLADVRRYGVVLEDSLTGEQEIMPVNTVAALAPEDAYDLALVVMRKNHVADILPALAANRCIPTVLFMTNNAAGPQALIDALGAERVLLGFPVSGGKREGHVIRIVPADPHRPWTLPIGEVDGRRTARVRRVAAALRTMPGYDVEIRPDMDAWLKHHVAVIAPLALALYAADTDQERMARTRDALVLGSRAMKEAARALEAAAVPLTPASLRPLLLLPEPLLIGFLTRVLRIERLKVSLEGHARAAHDEMTHLALELRQAIAPTGLSTPALEQLYPYCDPETPPLPAGSRALPLRWGELALPVLLVTGALAGIALLWRALHKSRR